MNTHLVVSSLLALAASVSASAIPALVAHAPVAAVVDTIPNPGYAFNYAVNDPSTGDNKAQWENRHGDVVQGEYSLVEPDGNVRTVQYSADPHRGFNAVVKKSGPTVHSVSVPVAAPIAVGTIDHAPVVPLAHAAPVAIAQTPVVAPIAHAPIAPIIVDAAPAAELLHDVGPIVHDVGPIVHDVAPIAHTPLIETAPIIAPLDLHLPLFHLPAPGPMVSVSGTTYGPKGHIVRRWTAGPISLDGKTLTIKTKH
ncbi:hypothetical protein ACJJTC_016288 [Scirpophaga incertulas]